MERETSEAAITRRILLAYGTSPTVRLFRNNVGVGLGLRSKVALSFGLCKGSSDLIGWRAPDGKFIALEVKVHGKHPTSEQEAFIASALAANCIAGVVRSVEDCIPLIGKPP